MKSLITWFGLVPVVPESSHSIKLSIHMKEYWIQLMLRGLGAICMLAVFPLVMPRSLLEEAHVVVGLGSFPHQPIAEYLARSVSALCLFYGGLLWVLARDIHRFGPIIKYQSVAIMLLSLAGIYFGIRAGLPAVWVIADAMGCWAFLLPVLILMGHASLPGPARRKENGRK